MTYRKRQLMLDEVIEKLQEAREEVGNVPVTLDIMEDYNMINDSYYKCTEVLYDADDVRFYNY